ncbi:hypothetical protein HDU98_007620 [Podochytrium sp. JEL0797]|nr:hypothetical protein HDU98_007620 [Podochytrium sp. JEL0797]
MARFPTPTAFMFTSAGRDQRMRIVRGVGLSVLVGAVLAAVYFAVVKGGGAGLGSGSIGLDGCFEASSGAAFSLFGSPSDPVAQNASQCVALLAMARQFGFAIDECSQNTTVTNPNDPTSFLTAGFCDTNTIYLVSVHNPPVSLNAVPDAMANLTNLWGLGMHNALYGNNVLAPLLNVLGNSKFFTVLNMTGNSNLMNVSTRVVSGSIPQIPMSLQQPFFNNLFVANNNLSGTFPDSMADTLPYTSFANNTHLTGPLPASTFTSITHTPQWTQSLECAFSHTNLCIPPSWPHQPACIRNATDALPTCTNSTNPSDTIPRPIDPSNPVITVLQPPNNGAQDTLTTVVKYAGVAILILVVLAGVIVYWKGRQYRQVFANRQVYSTSGYLPGREELERDERERAEREREMELPRYEARVPEYVGRGEWLVSRGGDAGGGSGGVGGGVDCVEMIPMGDVRPDERIGKEEMRVLMLSKTVPANDTKSAKDTRVEAEEPIFVSDTRPITIIPDSASSPPSTPPAPPALHVVGMVDVSRDTGKEGGEDTANSITQ